MMTPRIFVDSEEHPPVPGNDYALPAAAARHVAQALRMRAGDPVALFTGTGGEYATTIVRIRRRDVVVRIDRHDDIERESPSSATLVQAVIAADMMDLVVRRAVELGVAAIAPVQAARSQRLPRERAERRSLHWRGIAVAACEQCGRNRVPHIAPLVGWTEWIAGYEAGGNPIAILDPGAKHSLAALAARNPPRAIAVGPEGGFTTEELRQAVDRGAVAAHLGRRILRAETAALAALATLAATTGDAC